MTYVTREQVCIPCAACDLLDRWPSFIPRSWFCVRLHFGSGPLDGPFNTRRPVMFFVFCPMLGSLVRSQIGTRNASLGAAEN